MPNTKTRVSVALFVAAGVLYNSWPFGYILNRPTAQQGLASDLELVGQPYNWVFITGDILTAICVIAAALIVIARFPRKAVIIVMTGLITFGLFTAVSALLPSQCSLGVFRCGADHGQGLGLDTVTSSLAALGLLVSLAGLVITNRLKTIQGRLIAVVFAAWAISGIVFSWLALTNHSAHFAQDILMIMTGLAIMVIGLLDYALFKNKSD